MLERCNQNVQSLLFGCLFCLLATSVKADGRVFVLDLGNSSGLQGFRDAEQACASHHARLASAEELHHAVEECFFSSCTSGWLYGGTVGTTVCNVVGSTLKAVDVRTDNVTEDAAHRDAFCIRDKGVPCGDPPSFPNARLQGHSGFEMGDELLYTCVPGYMMPSGQSAFSLLCDSCGEWYGLVQICVKDETESHIDYEDKFTDSYGEAVHHIEEPQEAHGEVYEEVYGPDGKRTQMQQETSFTVSVKQQHQDQYGDHEVEGEVIDHGGKFEGALKEGEKNEDRAVEDFIGHPRWEQERTAVVRTDAAATTEAPVSLLSQKHMFWFPSEAFEEDGPRVSPNPVTQTTQRASGAQSEESKEHDSQERLHHQHPDDSDDHDHDHEQDIYDHDDNDQDVHEDDHSDDQDDRDSHQDEDQDDHVKHIPEHDDIDGRDSHETHDDHNDHDDHDDHDSHDDHDHDHYDMGEHEDGRDRTHYGHQEYDGQDDTYDEHESYEDHDDTVDDHDDNDREHPNVSEEHPDRDDAEEHYDLNEDDNDHYPDHDDHDDHNDHDDHEDKGDDSLDDRDSREDDDRRHHVIFTVATNERQNVTHKGTGGKGTADETWLDGYPVVLGETEDGDTTTEKARPEDRESGSVAKTTDKPNEVDIRRPVPYTDLPREHESPTMVPELDQGVVEEASDRLRPSAPPSFSDTLDYDTQQAAPTHSWQDDLTEHPFLDHGPAPPVHDDSLFTGVMEEHTVHNLPGEAGERGEAEGEMGETICAGEECPPHPPSSSSRGPTVAAIIVALCAIATAVIVGVWCYRRQQQKSSMYEMNGKGQSQKRQGQQIEMQQKV